MAIKQIEAKNVLGTKLQPCCTEPKTGFYRDGFCNTNHNDYGRHIVCAIMTDEFLEFSKNKGNNLITPIPEYNFPGLQAGDRWCLCASRWLEACNAGKAPPVILEACHHACLELIDIDKLKANRVQ